MLLAIVIAVVIIIIVFAVYNQVTATVNAAQTALFVQQLSTRITQTYRGDYRGLSPRAVIGSGFVPETWQKDGSTIMDPEGREVRFSVADWAGWGPSYAIMFSEAVPEETCKAVLNALRRNHTFNGAFLGNGRAVNAVDLDTPAKIQNECQAPKTFRSFGVAFR